MTDSSYSRGIDKIIALAALDAEFHRKLVADREAAINSCDIELSKSERAILLGIPNLQLDHAINNVKVPREARRQFLRGAVIAAVTLVIGTCLFVPSVVTAGVRADAPAAISFLRTISSVQGFYSSRHGRYAKTFKELVDTDIIDKSFIAGKRYNYRFEMTSDSNENYTIRAIPEKDNKMYFYMDQTGVIRYSDGPEVGPESREIGK